MEGCSTGGVCDGTIRSEWKAEAGGGAADNLQREIYPRRDDFSEPGDFSGMSIAQLKAQIKSLAALLQRARRLKVTVGL